MQQKFPTPQILAVVFSMSLAPSAVSAPASAWVADQGDGTYRNPVLHADYSDPDAIRVGRDFS